MSTERFPISADAAEWDVYDVVAAYSEEQGREPEDRTILSRWIARYPQFAGELSAIAYDAFATGESVFDAVDADSPSPAVETIARSVAYTHGVADDGAQSGVLLIGIISTAQERGLSPKELAARIRIDTPLLAKLDQRLIDLATVPARLVEMIAETIGRSRDDIAAYLAGPPRLAAQAHYKAEQASGLSGPGKQSFADALSASPKIAAVDRTFWQAEMKVE